jgi:cytochrome c oxidase subunit 2
MYSNASNFVKGVDNAFLFIIGVSTFFLVALTVVMIILVIKYNKKRNPVATQIHGSNTLEIIWTIIPLILVMVMFYFGWKGWKPTQEKAPSDAMLVKTTARMWSWTFQYPNGRATDTLYVPVGKAVKLDLVAQDVIHSLYIPAFRLKQDMVPNKKGLMWFIAEKPGTYDLFCTEYCGLRHSYMVTSVVAIPEKDFKSWYADTTTVKSDVASTPGAAGLEVLKKNGCLACHSTDGSKLVGPSYKGLYGHKVLVTANNQEKEVVADDEYIKRAIYDPNSEIVKGYSKNMMLSYKDLVTEEEIKQIIEYIKTLK